MMSVLYQIILTETCETLTRRNKQHYYLSVENITLPFCRQKIILKIQVFAVVKLSVCKEIPVGSLRTRLAGCMIVCQGDPVGCSSSSCVGTVKLSKVCRPMERCWCPHLSLTHPPLTRTRDSGTAALVSQVPCYTLDSRQ